MRITNRKGAKDAKEDDRFFSLADLRIGKRELSVLGALSEAPAAGCKHGRFKLLSCHSGDTL